MRTLAIALRTTAGRDQNLAVFARNLHNANYIQNLTIQAGNAGLIIGTPSDPRTMGTTLSARQ